MRLVSRLLIRIGIATGLLLILLVAIITLYVWTLNAKQAETNLQIEVSNSAASIRKFYSSGDLVALRGTLDQIAESSNWISASFTNLEGEKVWKFSKDESESNSSSSISLTKEVLFENEALAGRLFVSKDVSNSQQEFKKRIFIFISSGLVFWVFSVFVTLYISKKSLNPILVLMSDIKSEAQSKGVTFEEDRQLDEIRNIHIWFAKLSESWLNEKRRAMENERSAAIAQMTQMLAHDIRKPFSMFKAALETIMIARSASDLKLITQDFIPEIDRAMNSVNGLLQDVMEVSSKALPHFEQVRPESLIETTLVDLFSMQEESDINLSYELKHKHNIKADAQKMMRVFLNICGNAVQAMNGKGHLKFSTREKETKGKLFVEFSILNTNSFIPGDDIAHLFDAFYTKNKKGGTGLGLAIAQKVVTAHGGAILCRSRKDAIYPQGFVDFVFTIPAGEKTNSSNTDELPTHSSELQSKARLLRSRNGNEEDQSLGIRELEAKVIGGINRFNRILHILAADDEQVYKNAIRSHCERNQSIRKGVSIMFVNKSDDIALTRLDGAILDVDLGSESLNGFEIASKLREKFPNSFICVHSNRIFADDFKRSLESGADAFLPKPMSYEHFLGFLAQVCSRQDIGLENDQITSPGQIEVAATVSEKPPSSKCSGERKRDLVAIVDDSNLVRSSWALRMKDAPIECFENPETFLARLESSQDFSERLTLVVTDFHFGHRSELSGYEFALELRKRSDAEIVLSSDGEFDAHTLAPFALTIPKKAMSFAELADWVKTKKKI